MLVFSLSGGGWGGVIVIGTDGGGGGGCVMRRVDLGLLREDGVNKLSVSGVVDAMDNGGGVCLSEGRFGAGVDGCPEMGTLST